VKDLKDSRPNVGHLKTVCMVQTVTGGLLNAERQQGH
jgi:hypothetical protein